MSLDLEEWRLHALCRRVGIHPSLFFGKDVDPLVKSTCEACPVRSECLEYALRTDQKGYWGGTTGRERWKIRKHRRLNPPG